MLFVDFVYESIHNLFTGPDFTIASRSLFFNLPLNRIS